VLKCSCDVPIALNKCTATPCLQDGDGANSTTKSAAKEFAKKYRGVMMRPMTAAVTKAQADFKPFVGNAEDIDHNLYGKFLGILKGKSLSRHTYEPNLRKAGLAAIPSSVQCKVLPRVVSTIALPICCVTPWVANLARCCC
jgi:hypothetical protein